MSTLPAQILAMRDELIATLKSGVHVVAAKAVEDGGTSKELADALGNDGHDARLIATALADLLIGSGWVVEHPEGHLNPYEPDPTD